MISDLILKWYKKNKRNLVWRKTKNPYKIWVSEIILQQTKISVGTKYYLNFIKKFPNLESLSKGTDKEILKIWEGLGYYSRAINMLKTAKTLVENKKEFPSSYESLIKLKGIGDYTASAISSICKNEKRAVLDGNVFRVISRVFNISAPINTITGKKIFQKLTFKLLPDSQIGDYNQGLMDFGSLHCTIRNPKCKSCTLKNLCKSYKLNNIENRPRKIKRISAKKERVYNYLRIIVNNKLLIKKRSKKDIWKNLYELPLIESEENISEELLIKYLSKLFDSIKINHYRLDETINHKLSHQNITINFWNTRITVRKEKKNISLLNIKLKSIADYPFPKPILKYLNDYLNT